MSATFSVDNFHLICDELAAKDADLKSIIDKFGYPPMWTRTNSFETLVHIILEQQVSLASALAALNKLREKIGSVTPENLLQLTDEELKACYFSRQKTVYSRGLAQAIQKGVLDLAALEHLSDTQVRTKLVALKGFGNWTADVYLMFVLRRTDTFPAGDLAAVNALKQVKKLPGAATVSSLLVIADGWQPYRTIATMMLWHYYLSVRAKDTSTKTSKIKKAILL
ncbi:MAG: DNA-3-methyladenine glycosylase 2 family protein [Agriterribacter sp.]